MASFQEQFTPYGNLGLHGVRLPQFQIDKKYYDRLNISETADNYTFLKELCNKAFKDKGLAKLPNAKEYAERGKMELEVFKELGFVDYVLLIWDIINYCHENDIPVGPGRGSAAGSLVLFLIGITKIDPIKNGLYFERFVSKSRAKKTVVDGITYLDGSLLPDVDSDICYYKRKQVIKYIQTKFPSRTCKILTINTLSGKLVLKEVLKTTLEYTEEEVKVLAGHIEKVFGVVEKLSKAGEKSPALKKWLELPRQPYELMTAKEAFAIAMKLENLPKNFGVHPSAVVVSYDKLENFCPVQVAKLKKEDRQHDDEEYQAVSGYDMNWVAEFAVKVDVLGLRSVSVVDDVCKMLKLDINTINLDDKTIYDPLQDLRTPHGIFQIEAHTQYKACRDVKPNSLAEVSDLMALARPGALDYIKDYVENKGGKEIAPIEPNLDKILHETKHVALYQEQMMQIAHKVFGFTLDEAEILRRIVGKKKVDQMPEWKEKVYAKAKERGLSEDIAAMYWKILDDSSNYSFNKSHSVSYATLASWTLYLKFHHPQQFFLALFNMAKHEPKPHEEVSKISKELHYFGIKLLPPDLMLSDMNFKAEGADIRYGLSLLKGISEKTMASVLEFRDKQTANKFELFQAAKQAGLNIGVVSSLIQAGALSSLKGSRSYNVMEAQVFNVLSDSEKPYVMQLGAEFNYDLFKLLKTVVKEQRKRENGKTPIIKDSRYETIKKKCEKYLKIYQMNVKNEKLANWFFENKLLGYVYSSTLYDIMKHEIEGLSPLESFDSFENDDKVVFAGLVVEAQNTRSKQGKKMFRMTVEDGKKQLGTIFFDKSYEKWIEEHRDAKGNIPLPEKEDIVYIVGKKSNDIVFLQSMTTLDGKVYLKLSDLE
jgi:DNA polymerase-3 subunit alpha